ncbi:MAG: DoxX family protein [Mucilaginibacter sp.]|nr:DoxX family protein [Mucilaginibacter sp.]
MTKRNKIIYWISRIWLALGVLSTGAVPLFKGKRGAAGVGSITHLRYPTYLITRRGVWKILGVIAVLIPKFPLLKEWTYGGFFFVMSGTIFSQIALGNSVNEIFPALALLILTVVSWHFRPADSKIISVYQ